MPGFDGTGPGGMGPMTGGGRGYCAVPSGGRTWGFGRGGALGRGFRAGGRGRGGAGFGRGAVGGYGAWGAGAAMPYAYGATVSEAQELADLGQQAQVIEEQLEQIKRRIDELNNPA